MRSTSCDKEHWLAEYYCELRVLFATEKKVDDKMVETRAYLKDLYSLDNCVLI